MNNPSAHAGIEMEEPMHHPYLTVHTITALPWHNLNRDENGAPKQVTEGGVTRARLSSQSLKRAARIGFERDAEKRQQSLRTKLAVPLIVERVAELRGGLTKQEEKKLTTAIATRVKSLTHASESASDKETLVWLSAGELEQLAQTFAKDDDAPAVEASSTDSLAIAAFGRMFAAAPGLNIPAAVSVGDAVTTHAAVIELDWFASVDDAQTEHLGAGQLGFTMQTSGVYYRSFTLDRAQLARNWDLSLDSAEAEPLLRSFIRHITLDLPAGRSSGTAAQTLPALIVAEEQSHRVVYDFHQPVTADESGFLAPSIQSLLNKAADARAFDPDLFGAAFYSGTTAAHHLPSVSEVGSFGEYADFVVSHLREAA